MQRQLPWMKDLKEGSVLWNRSKTRARIVRKVSRYPTGELWGVTLAILNCSWTGRPYTTITSNDLIQQGYHPAPFRAKLNRLIDFQLSLAINDHHRRDLSCHDVKGVL